MQLVPRRILVALAAMLLPAAALAQNPSTITGTVTREDSTPLPGATVAIPSLGLGTTARADGRYALLIPAAQARGQPGCTGTPSHQAVSSIVLTRRIVVVERTFRPRRQSAGGRWSVAR